jgi:hypothetical protein
MKTKKLFVYIISIIATPWCFSQGFINLNFENAAIVYDSSGQFASSVYASNAVSGWTAYIAGVSQTDIMYNDRTLDNACVSLQGTNSSVLTPIQGYYTMLLLGASAYAQQQSASVGQTGQIPLTALSLIFWGYVGQDDVSFAGQTLSLVILGSTANYNIYGADISAFAGQTGLLLFTASPQEEDVIDNIQFLSSSVPEPNVISFVALGSALLVWCRWRKSA